MQRLICIAIYIFWNFHGTNISPWFTINFRANQSEEGAGKSGSGINDYVTSLFDQALTWKDIDWLKSITSLPIVVKGILTPEDAVIAIQMGVQASVTRWPWLKWSTVKMQIERACTILNFVFCWKYYSKFLGKPANCCHLYYLRACSIQGLVYIGSICLML